MWGWPEVRIYADLDYALFLELRNNGLPRLWIFRLVDYRSLPWIIAFFSYVITYNISSVQHSHYTDG